MYKIHHFYPAFNPDESGKHPSPETGSFEKSNEKRGKIPF
jgi:hypothetical protein